MEGKFFRRSFIKKLSVTVAGTVTFASCNPYMENKENSMATFEKALEKNRQMPRDLVKKLLNQKAKKYMNISYNCAQSSFIALQEQFELPGDDILKALTPLTGIAERGETCGAITGSLMAFGLIYGRNKNRLDDWDKYRNSLTPSGELCDKFEKIYGSTMCCKIQKDRFGQCFRLTNPDELKKFQNSGATERCTTVVQKAVEIAAGIILDNKTT